MRSRPLPRLSLRAHHPHQEAWADTPDAAGHRGARTRGTPDAAGHRGARTWGTPDAAGHTGAAGTLRSLCSACPTRIRPLSSSATSL